jgi:hypothetical protein
LKAICGTACCARAGGPTSSNNPTSQRFMSFSPHYFCRCVGC